jgi:hypothetical protein
MKINPNIEYLNTNQRYLKFIPANPKSKFLNPKQYQMFKKAMFKNLEHLDFEFV